MPEQPQYRMRLGGGEEFGPASLDELGQWAREGRVPKDALLVPVEGGEPRSVFAFDALATILNAPPTVPGPMQTAADDRDATGGLIPYKNPPALIGYYISVFSLIPCIALALGPTAIILGIIGLKKRADTPTARGAAHAWVAIVLGTLTTVGNIVGIVLMNNR